MEGEAGRELASSLQTIASIGHRFTLLVRSPGVVRFYDCDLDPLCIVTPGGDREIWMLDRIFANWEARFYVSGC